MLRSRSFFVNTVPKFKLPSEAESSLRSSNSKSSSFSSLVSEKETKDHILFSDLSVMQSLCVVFKQSKITKEQFVFCWHSVLLSRESNSNWLSHGFCAWKQNKTGQQHWSKSGCLFLFGRTRTSQKQAGTISDHFICTSAKKQNQTRPRFQSSSLSRLDVHELCNRTKCEWVALFCFEQFVELKSNTYVDTHTHTHTHNKENRNWCDGILAWNTSEEKG